MGLCTNPVQPGTWNCLGPQPAMLPVSSGRLRPHPPSCLCLAQGTLDEQGLAKAHTVLYSCNLPIAPGCHYHRCPVDTEKQELTVQGSQTLIIMV